MCRTHYLNQRSLGIQRSPLDRTRPSANAPSLRSAQSGVAAALCRSATALQKVGVPRLGIPGIALQ